jgi:hypothetical protein
MLNGIRSIERRKTINLTLKIEGLRIKKSIVNRERSAINTVGRP